MGTERGEARLFKQTSQSDLFDAGHLLPKVKQDRCRNSWAGPFRERALPLLREIEGEFAEFFNPEEGRPNRPVELVLGVLILKELRDLTDQEALEALEFDARWWWAFERLPSELHLSQKTLHNFRVKLMQHEKCKVAFEKVTDKLIDALELRVDSQRADSTHIVSNIAHLTRLALFCETIRLFLRTARKVAPEAMILVPDGLLARHGDDKYSDASKEISKRRLDTVARDVWRLRRCFASHEKVKATDAWAKLDRLYEEHCRVIEKPRELEAEDDDHKDGGAPVEPKPSENLACDRMRTPHDPDATCGYKMTGYEAQIVETCHEENPVEMITDVAVTPSCGVDTTQTVPIVERLEERGLKPTELLADTQYGGAQNAADLSKRDVQLVAPVPGRKPVEEPAPCDPPAAPCPTNAKEALPWIRQQEASRTFHERYSLRSGIEATNSELKRRHGLGRLRVRGGKRVELAVCFKALACNLKRALAYWLWQSRGSPVPV